MADNDKQKSDSLARRDFNPVRGSPPGKAVNTQTLDESRRMVSARVPTPLRAVTSTSPNTPFTSSMTPVLTPEPGAQKVKSAYDNYRTLHAEDLSPGSRSANPQIPGLGHTYPPAAESSVARITPDSSEEHEYFVPDSSEGGNNVQKRRFGGEGGNEQSPPKSYFHSLYAYMSSTYDSAFGSPDERIFEPEHKLKYLEPKQYAKGREVLELKCEHQKKDLEITQLRFILIDGEKDLKIRQEDP
ncbi:hypothetical protein K458DRAFT_389947 [Lentithecium fluviatile CBS 122367]|uniref:Uncharacterized protein n=1 Tax=Lentithecium fluviatile CBS 122367 TaxID=1168545 RepID=A0A6G1IZM6_9PLEO|nr:hypothetical protein K458DRAFT_389947 [Lentithecium fluviatile CBS 122367]